MAQTRIIQSIPEGDTITVNCQLSIVNFSVSGKMGTKKPGHCPGIVEIIH